VEVWKRELQWNRRRTAARSDIHQPFGGGRNISRREQRLEQQTVNGLIWISNRGQIDLLIPPEEKTAKRIEFLNELIVQKKPDTGGPTSQSG
jgi:hypothetical protein